MGVIGALQSAIQAVPGAIRNGPLVRVQWMVSHTPVSACGAFVFSAQ